jgi:hypothetical protein
VGRIELDLGKTKTQTIWVFRIGLSKITTHISIRPGWVNLLISELGLVGCVGYPIFF